MEHSQKLSHILGYPTYLKLENLQLTGSFKIRGAFFRLSQLSQQEKASGIIACSAGNHGKAIAYVAQKLGIPATIYVPHNVDQSKFNGMKSYGAHVIRSPHVGYDDTERLAKNIAKETGKPFISPYDDDSIMAANGGTLAKEILTQVPDLQTLILPVGGGGMAAGASYYAKQNNKDIHIIGCQHRDSPALQLSLDQGKAITTLPAIETFAGGIEGGIGESCFTIIQPRIDQCCLANEEEIIQGFHWCLEHHNYLIEPTAAVVIAAALNGSINVKQGPAVMVLSGRNVSLQTMRKILCTA